MRVGHLPSQRRYGVSTMPGYALLSSIMSLTPCQKSKGWMIKQSNYSKGMSVPPTVCPLPRRVGSRMPYRPWLLLTSKSISSSVRVQRLNARPWKTYREDSWDSRRYQQNPNVMPVPVESGSNTKGHYKQTQMQWSNSGSILTIAMSGSCIQ